MEFGPIPVTCKVAYNVHSNPKENASYFQYQDLAERLRVLGYAPERYVEMVESEGVEFLRRFIGRLEEADRLFQEWEPRLREFARDCRAKSSEIDPSELTDRDRVKLPIYEGLIQKAERLTRGGAREAVICSVPLLAMSMARALWPGKEERCVLPTPEEVVRWGEIYQHPDESFWWFMKYWWSVEDPPVPNMWRSEEHWKTPAGTEPWLVISGTIWGGLAGGEREDLWAWDGREAVFVRNVCVGSF